jgi:hypothetical protein
VSGICDLERKEQPVHPLPEPRRMLHRAAHTGRSRALPAGQLEARTVRETALKLADVGLDCQIRGSLRFQNARQMGLLF